MSELTEILKQVLPLMNKVIQIEGIIETKIKQVKDVKKRKAIRGAIADRDRDALNKLLFDN